ncbi:cystatin-like [Sardina pilchardus]|uniref:cystatin-like n=1 Tax=Sardina pilchardus TaxID=27697 RepID=UPI002E1032FD
MVVMWKILVPIFMVAFAMASAGLIGGPSEANINDEGVQNALQFAVVQHNKMTNDAFINKVSKVVKVQKQVVAGMKYIFTVEMARTNCRKGGVETECEIHADLQLAKPYTCTFEVWSRPWLGPPQIIKNDCKH